MVSTSRKRVAVIYGSRSVEHEVSIVTAQQVMNALDADRYEVLPVYIGKDGAWYSDPRLFTRDPDGDVAFHNDLIQARAKARAVMLPPDPEVGGLLFPAGGGLFARPKTLRLDVAIPVTHGTHGEDGTLQGLLELAGVPYVGCNVAASAVGMDKILTKAILTAAGIDNAGYAAVSRSTWQQNPEEVRRQILEKPGLPAFVKPACLGSSIGITRVQSPEDLPQALDLAATYGDRILVEEALSQVVEINCSVMGNTEPVASVCEQPVSWQEFLTYDEKYLHGGEAGMKGADRRIPAPLPEALTERIQSLAVRVFRAMNGSGIARVDFLVDPEAERVYVNEINTIPGSYAFHLWRASGWESPQLMDRLIELALEAHAEKKRTTFTYPNSLLDRGSFGLGIKK